MPRHLNTKLATDVIVTDPEAGMRRMDAAMRHIMSVPKPRQSSKKHRKHKK